MHRTHTLYDLQHEKSTAPSSLFSTNARLLWFKSIEHQQLCHLSNQNLNELMALKILPEFTLFESLHRLYEDPMAGTLEDGELLQTVAYNFTEEFWKNHPKSNHQMTEFLTMLSTFKVAENYHWKSEIEKKNYFYALETLSNQLK